METDLIFVNQPARGDALTVREMARIYGFPDDFVFYEGINPYSYFSTAVPPTIARTVAKGVCKIINSCRGLELGENSVERVSRAPRGNNKWQRL